MWKRLLLSLILLGYMSEITMENFNVYVNKECGEVISHSSYVAGRLYDVPQGPPLPAIHIFG